MPRPVNVSPVRSGRGEWRGSRAAATRRLQIAQAEGDRVGAGCGGDLVDEGFAGELDLRADPVAQMRGAQRRGAVEQRGDRLPGQPLVGKSRRIRRHAKALQRLQPPVRGTRRVAQKELSNISELMRS